MLHVRCHMQGDDELPEVIDRIEKTPPQKSKQTRSNSRPVLRFKHIPRPSRSGKDTQPGGWSYHINPPGTPQQRNTVDCGVACFWMMRALADSPPGENPMRLVQHGGEDLTTSMRQRLAAELMSQGHPVPPDDMFYADPSDESVSDVL